MRTLLTIAGFLLTLAPLWSQRYLFKDYRQESGLANLVVTAMLQDDQNLLWIGTQNGLYRYDGTRMEAVGRDGGMSGIFVLALAKGPDGAVWVNSHQGLGRIQNGKAELERDFLEGNEEAFLGLGVAPNGNVFASTIRGMLIGRKTGAQYTYSYHWLRLNAEQASRPIRQIAVDKQSRAWFGCGQALCRTTGLGEVESFSTEAGLPRDEYTGIQLLRDDTLYLRSASRLLRLAPGTTRWQALTTPFSLQGPPFLALGSAQDLLVPTASGLARLSPNGSLWDLFGEEQGIPGDRLSALLEDHEHSLWLGFLGDGMKRWLGYREWEAYTKRDGLRSDSVWSILRDHQGVLWAATEAGLHRFDAASKRWQPFGTPGSALQSAIYSLTLGEGSRLYAMSLAQGLLEIDTRTLQSRLWGKPPGVRRNYHIHIDQHPARRGQLWLGTAEGLYTAQPSQPSRWQIVELPDTGSPNTVFTIHQDHRGRLWAATNHGVAYTTDETAQHWTRLTKNDGLLSNSVWYAKETRPGEFWLGYLESKGASRLKFSPQTGQPEWMHVAETLLDRGPPEFVTYFNGLDKSGLHWLGTDRGVFVAGPGASRIRHFTDEDGLIWNDCNSNAFFADSDGSVWIGTSRGLAHFMPKWNLFPDPPTLRLRRLQIGDQTWDQPRLADASRWSVPATNRSVEWEVSPVSFRFESRLLFRFRPHSTDGKWITQKSNIMFWEQLPPGQHILEAQVRIERLPWSASLTLPLSVQATFWESWLGRTTLSLGVLFASALAVVSLWRIRNQRLLAERATLTQAVQSRTQEIQKLLSEAQEANQLKSQFLANMSHEIRTPMNGVLGMLQLIEKGSLEEGQREYVGLAKTSAESLLNLLNEILDLSKVESGQVHLEILPFHLGELLRGTAGLLEANATKKGLRLELEITPAAEHEVLGDPLRLKQVLFNLLGNAIKFTESGRVCLSVLVSGENYFEFRVSDEGIGIPPEKQQYIFDAFRQADGSTTRRYGGTGLGLAISQRLLHLMGGQIAVESAPGQGSQFYFRISLPRPLAVPHRPPLRFHPLPLLPTTSSSWLPKTTASIRSSPPACSKPKATRSTSLPMEPKQPKPSTSAASTSYSWTSTCRSWMACALPKRFAPGNFEVASAPRKS